MLRVLLGCLALLVALPLVGEGALQLAARFVPDRGGEWRPGAAVRVLSVGDSHTFGAGVDPDQSYPAHLQRFLDAREPGRWSVINLGIPGLSTTQVRSRLPMHVARYRPDVVILWCGVNDVWNYTGVGRSAEGIAARLDALATRSRLYRLGRVWLHDHELERSALRTRADGRSQAAKGDLGSPLRERWLLHHGGIVDEVHSYRGASRLTDEVEARVYEDLRAMVRWLRAAGIEPILIRYPLDGEPFGRANRGITRVAEEEGIPLVDGRASVFRLPREARLWLHALHPNGDMYREIARDIAPLLEGPRVDAAP